jgi:hypothetical protein
MADSPTPQDPFEMFRRLWGPLGVPVPGMAMPTLDPAEVERRIADLRSIENWLTMNVNMVRFAIQGLELQRAALQAMRPAGGPGSAPAGAEAPHAMMWPWTMMQQAMSAGVQQQAKRGQGEPPDSGGEK